MVELRDCGRSQANWCLTQFCRANGLGAHDKADAKPVPINHSGIDKRLLADRKTVH